MNGGAVVNARCRVSRSTRGHKPLDLDVVFARRPSPVLGTDPNLRLRRLEDSRIPTKSTIAIRRNDLPSDLSRVNLLMNR